MISVAIIQSSYLPWKGYFDIINDADYFVFYDDVQYTSRDWRSRNRIKTSKGVEWITIPVGTSRSRLVCDVNILDESWQAKHWNTVRQSYSRAQFFDKYRGFFEDVYLGRQWPNLSDLNQFLIREISENFLGIRTKFLDSRSYLVSGEKTERLLNIARNIKGTRYISGPSAKDYIDIDAFERAGVELVWKNYEGYPEYPQRFPPFTHGVSIIDLIFNVGPDAASYIWGWRT